MKLLREKPQRELVFPDSLTPSFARPSGSPEKDPELGVSLPTCFRPVLSSTGVERPLVIWEASWWAGLPGICFPPDSSVH